MTALEAEVLRLQFELFALKNYLGLCLAAPAGASCPAKRHVSDCFRCIDPHEAAQRTQRILGRRPPRRTIPRVTDYKPAVGAPWRQLPRNLSLRKDDLPPPNGCSAMQVAFTRNKRSSAPPAFLEVFAMRLSDGTLWTSHHGLHNQS